MAEVTLKFNASAQGLEREMRTISGLLGTIRTNAATAGSALQNLGRQGVSAAQQVTAAWTRAAQAVRAAAPTGAQAVGAIRAGQAAGGGGLLGGGAAFAAGPAGVALGTVAAVAGVVTSSIPYGVESYRAGQFLESAGARAGISAAEQQRLLLGLRVRFGLSETDAQTSLAQALRVAGQAGLGNRGAEFLTATLRAAQASGIGRERVPDILRQIGTGQDEATDLLLGVNPSTLYERAARAQGRSAASLSDLEKAQIRVNAVIAEGNKSVEASGRYAESAAGKYDRLTAAADDLWSMIGRGAVSVLTAGITVPEEAGTGSTSFWSRLVGGAVRAGGGLVGQGLAAVSGYFARRGAGVTAGLEAVGREEFATANALALLQARSPLDQIRARYDAREREIDERYKDDPLSAGRAAAITGNRVLRSTELDRTRADITNALQQQLDALAARNAGERNPVVRIFAEGANEARKVAREIANLGPEFAAFGQQAQLGLGRQVVGAAIGAQGGLLGNIAALQARRAQLTPTLQPYLETGRYGQVTGEYGIREVFAAETGQQQAARAFAYAAKFERDIAGALEGSPYFTGGAGATRAAQAGREYLLSALSGLSPEDLTADQRRNYIAALDQQITDAANQYAEGLLTMKAIATDVAALRKYHVKGDPDDPKAPEQVTIVLEDKTAADVRLANQASGTQTPILIGGAFSNAI